MARGMYRVSSDWEMGQHGSMAAGRGACLVEEDILPVAAFCRKVLEVAILVDAVFLAQLLPELASHCLDVSKAALVQGGGGL